MKTKILKTKESKELNVFYKKIIQNTESVIKAQTLIRICGIILVIDVIGIIFLQHIKTAFELLTTICVLFVILIIATQLFLIYLKKTATFSLVDLENAIEEFQTDFEYKKSKRKSIDLISLEKEKKSIIRKIEEFDEQIYELEKKEEAMKDLSREDKKLLSELEDGLRPYQVSLEKLEIKLKHNKKIILLQDKEDKEYEENIKAITIFMKENFDKADYIPVLQNA